MANIAVHMGCINRVEENQKKVLGSMSGNVRFFGFLEKKQVFWSMSEMFGFLCFLEKKQVFWSMSGNVWFLVSAYKQ